MILPPLNTLQAFEAAARYSSLSKAGEELNITHAAISGQMKRLEDWMGRKLFERSGRGVVLTPAGEELHKTVAASLSAISLTSQALRRRKDKKSLTVACVPSIATRWLIPALPDFAKAHPDIEIHVSYATAFQDFDPERHDVLINNQNVASEALCCVKLFSRINKPVASPIYLERTGVDERLDGAHLLHDETPAAWEEWFAKAGFRPQGMTRGPIYQDFNLLSTAVIAGHGIALCPIEVFRREISQGDLVIMSDVATFDDQGYYLISDNHSNRLVATFSQWLLDACSVKLPKQRSQ
ncbi:LysR substrate-binding domain-containing protein [Paraburkholderia hospita]|uniref:LysR substrate-binding domain-containing protein n=1 Tax=Paraburkholderia hospita TaxID=169430 RepID=UPI0002718B64|nr:LysR substrate-binding domain-containing protein [Paraburkholderia hospita]EUC20812.1 transcriptional regulator, LysR family [Burkholderia sp. BT03]SKD08335.1 DNA-binding transcriptional regulator, LysR family [Paraburkholderia hospita]